MKATKFVKRTVGYWLICGGTRHHGGRGGGTIAPDVQHFHRTRPYAVLCAECAEKELNKR